MRHQSQDLDTPTDGQDIRLAAQAVHASAMHLLGHAEQLNASHPGGGDGEPIRLIAQQLLCLSDDLQDNAADGPNERLVLEPELVALAPVVRQVAASVSAMICGRRNWRVAPSLEALVLQADRRALRQIFMRVLANAARFSGDGDWIDIEARCEPTMLVVSVLDEGHPPAAGTGISTDRRGVRLGLVLSRRLMQAHGGSLAVDSEPGIGTCVRLNFPISLIGEAAG